MYFLFILCCLSKKCCLFYIESYYIKWVITSWTYSTSIIYRKVRTRQRALVVAITNHIEKLISCRCIFPCIPVFLLRQKAREKHDIEVHYFSIIYCKTIKWLEKLLIIYPNHTRVKCSIGKK